MAHDAVLLWAYGVNKTLEQGYAPNDGVRVTNNIINSTIQGVTGKIVIDENGDRLRDFKVSFIFVISANEQNKEPRNKLFRAG